MAGYDLKQGKLEKVDLLIAGDKFVGELPEAIILP
jgi:hypothetical protein